MLDAMDYFSVRTDTMRCRVRFGKAHFQKPTVLEGSGAKQEVADPTDARARRDHPVSSDASQRGSAPETHVDENTHVCLTSRYSADLWVETEMIVDGNGVDPVPVLQVRIRYARVL